MGNGAVEWNDRVKKLYWLNIDIPYAMATLPKHARILDLGGGNDPHPAADVIVDKFLHDNAQRGGQCPLLTDIIYVTHQPNGTETTEKKHIPIVCADGIALPFPDKSFDFIIAKDVLEHIEDIHGAMAEISRVGRAGFIDVPRITSEMIFPHGPDVHKWVFDFTNDGGIVAHSIVNFHSPFGRHMHNIFAKNKHIRNAWAKCRRHFHVVFLWQDSIDCEIGEEIQTP